VLGFTTAQMNRDHDYGGTVDNQIHALSQAGYFSTEVTGIHTLRTHVAAGDSSASLESRVRSYLAVNCVQCHQPGGPTSAAWDARLNTLTADAGLIDGHLRNNFGVEDARVIKPGSPDLSVMLQRISTRGSTQMPPLASHVVDATAVQLLTEWIATDAVSLQSFAAWQAANFADPLSPEAGPAADPDHDGSSNYLEFLLRSDPKVAGPPWTISAEREGDVIRIRFPRKAGRGFEVQSITNPFEAASWQSLDVPGNEPFFSAGDVESVVEDRASDGAQKFYRVRVFEE
jgi:mono/diheme cytochrome c family protein